MTFDALVNDSVVLACFCLWLLLIYNIMMDCRKSSGGRTPVVHNYILTFSYSISSFMAPSSRLLSISAVYRLFPAFCCLSVPLWLLYLLIQQHLRCNVLPFPRRSEE